MSDTAPITKSEWNPNDDTVLHPVTASDELGMFPMDMDEYQQLAGDFIAFYDERNVQLLKQLYGKVNEDEWVRIQQLVNFKDCSYPLLALAEETGEVLGKVAKLVRGDPKMTKLSKAEFDELLVKELGDVLFNIAAICTTRGLSLDYVANANIAKLTDRRERNQIKGEGDFR